MSQMLSARNKKRTLLAIACGAPVLFAISMAWLRDLPDWLVFTLAIMMGLTVMFSTLSLAAVSLESTDEWHREAAKFGAQWGWPMGAALFPFVLILPPAKKLIANFASSLDQGISISQEAALMIFMMGFICVVVLQAVCTMVAGLLWRLWMSRAV
ncbi:MAG: hypothetical protein CMK06_13005 [Ponticaulis sp.]|nr:hypothetical protein [Ponticaulis sp.]